MTPDSVRSLTAPMLVAATIVGGLIGWSFGEPISGAIMMAPLLGTAIWLAWRSDQRRMEALRSHERLVERERLYRELVETALHGIVVIEAAGQILLANQAAATMFGYGRPEDLLALETIDLLFGPEAQLTMEQYRQIDRIGGAPVRCDVRVRRPDGSEIWCEVQLHRTSWEERLVTEAFFVDITERKRTEVALNQAHDATEAANRTKSEFLANMNHEIRTPMNAVIGLSHLALAACCEPAQGETLRKIVDSSKALLGTIDDILEFSKIEMGDLEVKRHEFSLEEVTESLRVMLGITARQRNLELVVQQSPGLPKILIGDSLRLSQILRILIANSIKFSEDGSIIVTIDETDRTEAGITLRFSVCDHGIGMSEEQQGRLFQAFSQGDSSTMRRYGGIGLGLVICKRLVEAMGGNITVDTVLGQGSTFSFTLGFGLRSHPARRSRDVGTEIASEYPVPRLTGVRVLIVEDNPINQAVAQGIMASAGAISAIAANGREAVDCLQTNVFDVVLMDLQMPVMDGYAATRAIRRDLGLTWLPIIAVTAHALEEEKRRCREAGMNEHLSKPVEPELLINTVHAMVEAQALPGIDMRDAMSRLDGNRALLDDGYRDFCDRYRNAADEIAGLIATGGIEDAATFAHIIEGVAGNLGAKRVSAAARRVLVKLKADGGAAELVEALRVTLVELCDTPPSAWGLDAPKGSDQVDSEKRA